MSDIPVSADGKRLVGKGEVDPAEANLDGPPTKTIRAGKHNAVEVPIRTGEGGGGTGGGSPGELTYPPTSQDEAQRRSPQADAVEQSS